MVVSLFSGAPSSKNCIMKWFFTWLNQQSLSLRDFVVRCKFMIMVHVAVTVRKAPQWVGNEWISPISNWLMNFWILSCDMGLWRNKIFLSPYKISLLFHFWESVSKVEDCILHRKLYFRLDKCIWYFVAMAWFIPADDLLKIFENLPCNFSNHLPFLKSIIRCSKTSSLEFLRRKSHEP